jgi:hypothetical protein
MCYYYSCRSRNGFISVIAEEVEEEVEEEEEDERE